MISKKEKELLQCAENIRAGLAFHGFPRLKILTTHTTKVIFEASTEFIYKLEGMKKEFSPYFYCKNHGLTALTTWRENVPRFSMQIVEHTDAIEVDYDMFNPNYGAGPGLFHLIEVLWPGKTNPFKIMRGLQKRGIPVKEIT